MARLGTWGSGALLVWVLASGCARRVPDLAVLNKEEPFRIGREDVLDVSVWRDPDLSRTLPVRPDGCITLPIVGEIEAAGKTPLELEGVIREKLAPYVQSPKVSVIVREVNSSRVFVTGEVARPGAYPLRGRVSLVQALALAGGLSDFANSNGIVVLRSTGGTEQRIPVSYGDLIAAGGMPLYLRSGDTVVVP